MNINKSPYDFLENHELEVWNKANDCNCIDRDCKANHKLCALCEGTVVFNAYIACQPNSEYRWNIDHIIPTTRFQELSSYARERNVFGVNDIKNLQITHVSCNQIKGNRFNPNYKNGYGLIE